MGLSWTCQRKKGLPVASGRKHAAASLVAAAPTGLIVGLTCGPVVGLGATVGCLGGIILSPDMDQEGISKTEWAIVKYLGPLGFLFMAWSWPYAKLIKHRSPWSHFPIVGTAGRLAYCALWLSLAWLLLGCPDIPAIPLWGRQLSWGFVAGQIVSGSIHWFMDGCPI